METTKQRPSLGRIVIVAGVPSNGADEQPALITRVWNDDSVNVHVHLDAASDRPVIALTSLPLYASKELGVKAGLQLFAYWPART